MRRINPLKLFYFVAGLMFTFFGAFNTVINVKSVLIVGYSRVVYSTAVGCMLIWVIPLAMLGAGIYFLYKLIQPVYAGRLIKTGKSVTADVISCGLSNLRVNRLNTYVVECKWMDESGINHFYKSENLMYDPQDCFVDNKVEVFVDPNNYRKYKVNL